jgi:hypothetical protein
MWRRKNGRLTSLNETGDELLCGGFAGWAEDVVM